MLVRAPVVLPDECRHVLAARQRLMAVQAKPVDCRTRGRADGRVQRPRRPQDHASRVGPAAWDRVSDVRWRIFGLIGVRGLGAAGQGFGIVAESSACVALPGGCYRLRFRTLKCPLSGLMLRSLPAGLIDPE